MKEQADKARRAGEIIQSDVCGPMPVSTISGKRYFVTFINSWSHFKYVSLLARKSKVLQKFNAFKTMFERKFDCTVKNVYSDNGGEYRGMVNYLTMKGIGVYRAAPYTPEQNGVAERTNRTVLDMARSMLRHAGMSAQFWGEAVATATDIRNHIGIRRSSVLTPLELLTGKIPYIGNFAHSAVRLGYTCLNRKEKLAKSSMEAILLRSLTHSFYGVWFTDTQTVQHVRHVMINEDVFLASCWEVEVHNSVSNLQLGTQNETDGNETDDDMPGLLEEFDGDEEDSDTEEEASTEGFPSQNDHEATCLEQAVSPLSSGVSVEDLTYVPNAAAFTCTMVQVVSTGILTESGKDLRGCRTQAWFKE